MKSTDEKLRELVASWTWRSRVFESDYEHEQGKSNAYLMCADELLSILDIQSVREGVSDEMVTSALRAAFESQGSAVVTSIGKIAMRAALIAAIGEKP